MVNIFSQTTDIKDLDMITLYGSSIQSMPKIWTFKYISDYEKHPLLKNKERRLNIILYLNKTWKDEWNGDTELWNTDMTKNVLTKK